MIPAALLNVQHHHLVLDLCAAPGSKTLQALDSLYSSYSSWHASSALTLTPAPLPGLLFSLLLSLSALLSVALFFSVALCVVLFPSFSRRARARTHTHTRHM
jgi:hypothetical protein